MEEDMKISEMMEMQKELWELHKEKWSPMEAEYGKNFLLYMVEEMGEVIAIIKKKGNKAIMEDTQIRKLFLEESADVLMYYFDTLLRYHVTPQEIAQAYKEKHNRNLQRDYKKEYKDKFVENK